MNGILLITDIFPPDIGGPATFIDQLGHELARDHEKVTVVCTSAQADVAADDLRPMRIRRILRRPPSLRQSLIVRAVLAQEILRHRWIFSNGLEYPTAQVCRWLKRPFKLKVVGDVAWETARNTGTTELSIDSFQEASPIGHPWQKFADKRTWFAEQAETIITPSNYLREMVIGWGVAPQRVVTVLNGIHLNEFASFQPKSRQDGIFRLLYIGRLTNWKGVDTILHAIADLPNVHLDILGGGPEEAALRRLCTTLNLDQRVHFRGSQSRATVQDYLRQADALALISQYEGLSHTLLEACAAGVPCIASSCGGNPEVIKHGENGLLVAYGDIAQVRSALVRLEKDEPYRYRMACTALASSNLFDFAQTVRQTAEIITH